jgi:ribosomal protein S21
MASSKGFGRMVRPGMVAIAAIAISAASAMAQGQGTQPAAADGYGTGAAPAPAAITNEGYAPSSYPEAFAPNVFYPGQELRALPATRAQLAASRAELRRAEQALNNAVEDVRRNFKRSTELNQALAEEREAYEQLQVARQDAMNDLRNDQNYLAALRLRQRLAEQVERAQHDSRTTGEEMLALATVKLTYAATASAMEAAAVSAEPRVKEARERLVAAGRRVSELRQRFDENVRTDPVVIASRNALANARIAAQASEAMYIDALRVANVSMNFAYDLRRFPYPLVSDYYPYYSNGYGYSGYGYYGEYGYGVGYPVGYPYMWGAGAGQPVPARAPRSR